MSKSKARSKAKVTTHAKMTTHERFTRMFEHRPADRVPVDDAPWGATIERWHREGLPEGVSWVDYFDLDKVATIGVDNSPRWPVKVLEETDQYTISTSPWGVTMKQWKHAASTPEFLDYKVVDRDTWAAAKARMTPARDRVNWEYLRQNYPRWRKEGWWIQGGGWFGFDVAHSWMSGTERILMALVDDPEWCVDIFNHYLDVNLALLDMVWQAGYTFDSFRWPDDMGFKHNQFFSLRMYRELVKPVQRRAIEWAHAKGVKAHLHSCGDITPLVPDLVEMGLDALNPLEVKAGMDGLALKRQYGDRLVLHGGVNAVLWTDLEAIEAEMRKVIPALKQGGGYIFASDHSIPSSVSFDGMTRIVTLVKELGAY
jgi:uroporphyrinogen decarboxylase